MKLSRHDALNKLPQIINRLSNILITLLAVVSTNPSKSVVIPSLRNVLS